MTQNLIYIIPVVALIAMLWSSRNAIKKFFKKETVPVPASGRFFDIVKRVDILAALSFLLFTNHGEKQQEEVFRNQAKQNSQSESCKNMQANIFTTD
jgi:hypothetical protein